MSVGEFKAWLDGYLEGKPQPKEAVKRIREKLSEVVEVKPCTYWHGWSWPYWVQPALSQTLPRITCVSAVASEHKINIDNYLTDATSWSWNEGGPE